MLRHTAHRLTRASLRTVRFTAGVPLRIVGSATRLLGLRVEQTPEHAAEQAGESTATPPRAATQEPPVEATDEPHVVLAMDAPPEEVEPPVDVVGEALAEEQAAAARRPSRPQPTHVPEETEVVYSSSSRGEDTDDSAS